MGIISRFSDIMRSNINALLDKCEDPAKMIDQTLLDLRKDLAEVKKETAGVMADAKSADRKVQECEANIAKYAKAAENALLAGNEADARTLIGRKQEMEQTLTALKETKALADANASKMQQMYDKLVNDINTLETKRDAIKAKVASAKAQEHINKISGGGDKARASMEAFERMEAKADRMLDAAQAEADLNSQGTSDSLVNKYADGAGNASVDNELDALKAKLGL